jgi:hypothetical protein
VTPARAAVLVAVLASASSVYLALASTKAQAAAATEWITDAGACPAADAKHVTQ